MRQVHVLFPYREIPESPVIFREQFHPSDAFHGLLMTISHSTALVKHVLQGREMVIDGGRRFPLGQELGLILLDQPGGNAPELASAKKRSELGNQKFLTGINAPCRSAQDA